MDDQNCLEDADALEAAKRELKDLEYKIPKFEKMIAEWKENAEILRKLIQNGICEEE